MICKDCYHCSVCCGYDEEKANRKYPSAEKCRDFKDKSRIVELPCNIGDKIYRTDFVRVYESTINEVIITTNKAIYVTENIAFDERAIGKTVFLARKEAEESLRKEREK